MFPFLDTGGISSHITEILVDVSAITVTLGGAIDGTKGNKNCYHYQLLYYNMQWPDSNI